MEASQQRMSTFDDLSGAIRAVHDTAGPAVVGIGRGIRGSGIVIADGRVLTNAHNLRGDEVTVTFRDGRTDHRHGQWRRPRRRPGGRRRSTRPARRRSAGPSPIRPIGDVVFGLAATGSGAARVTPGFVSAVEQSFRGPGGVEDRRQPRAHRADGPGLVRRPARRRGRRARRDQHEPDRRGVLPGPSGRRGAPRAGRRARPRRVGRPAASRRRDRAAACRPPAAAHRSG